MYFCDVTECTVGVNCDHIKVLCLTITKTGNTKLVSGTATVC